MNPEPINDPVIEPTTTTRPHRGHVFCPADGFCVPGFLHAEFERQLGHRVGEFDLLGWYVVAEHARADTRPVVADPLHWWRQAFRGVLLTRGWVTERREAPRRTEPIAYRAFECPHEPQCSARWQCHRKIQFEKAVGA